MLEWTLSLHYFGMQRSFAFGVIAVFSNLIFSLDVNSAEGLVVVETNASGVSGLSLKVNVNYSSSSRCSKKTCERGHLLKQDAWTENIRCGGLLEASERKACGYRLSSKSGEGRVFLMDLFCTCTIDEDITGLPLKDCEGFVAA